MMGCKIKRKLLKILDVENTVIYLLIKLKINGLFTYLLSKKIK